MVSLAQVRDAFKTIAPGYNQYNIGKLNSDKENELGFFPMDAPTSQYHKFLGEQIYRILPCQIIVHGFKDTNDGYRKTEQKANDLYEIIERISKLKFDGFEIVNVKLVDNYPRCLWTNSNDIYEFSIETYMKIAEEK